MGVKGGIKEYTKVINEIKNIENTAQAVISRTISDVRTRGHGWIAQGVSQRYGIKKSEVSRVNGIGRLDLTQRRRHHLQLKYSGRPLTLSHFGMTPKTPNPNGYTLKAKVYRIRQETISKVKKPTKKQYANIARNFHRQGTRNSPRSPWMLQHTGNTKEGGINYIPFQRRKQPGTFQYTAKGPSLPQMVTEGKDGPFHREVALVFNNKLEDRWDHHCKQFEK